MEPLVIFLSILDLVGSFAFALSGAALAVRRGFDVFGVLLLAFVTAVSGGIARDVLIGAIPPAALRTWYYLGVSLLAGLLTFGFHPWIRRLKHPVQLSDAAGLAIFAVVGTNKALAYGLEWPAATLLGMLSAIGGGMVRDVLAAQVPMILRTDIYAVAAIAGGLVVSLGRYLELPEGTVTLIGAGVCFVLRVLAIERGWKLPGARERGEGEGED